MLRGLVLLLLMELSVGTAAGDSEEELSLSIEAGPRVTVTLEEGTITSIQLQLQEAKSGKASQFFGLMGKQVGGTPRIKPGRPGYQLGRMIQGLLGRKGPPIEGTEDEDPGCE